MHCFSHDNLLHKQAQAFVELDHSDTSDGLILTQELHCVRPRLSKTRTQLLHQLRL